MVISTLAGRVHRIMVLESETYLLAIDLVIYSMFSGWSEPAIGILVIPGKSTMVRSGHVGEKIVSLRTGEIAPTDPGSLGREPPLGRRPGARPSPPGAHARGI